MPVCGHVLQTTSFSAPEDRLPLFTVYSCPDRVLSHFVSIFGHTRREDMLVAHQREQGLRLHGRGGDR